MSTAQGSYCTFRGSVDPVGKTKNFFQYAKAICPQCHQKISRDVTTGSARKHRTRKGF